MAKADLRLKLTFCRIYWECVTVGEPKWMFSLRGVWFHYWCGPRWVLLLGIW